VFARLPKNIYIYIFIVVRAYNVFACLASELELLIVLLFFFFLVNPVTFQN
jgi:hypothetical protein